jgi:hypothetical protein
MSTLIQIRKRARFPASQAQVSSRDGGKPLSEYPLAENRETADRPTIAELRARLVRRSRVCAFTGSGAGRQGRTNFLPGSAPDEIWRSVM